MSEYRGPVCFLCGARLLSAYERGQNACSPCVVRIAEQRQFREPAGRRTLKLCLAESCQAAGGRALEARAKQKLGVGMGETTIDRRVTLEPIYCLGLCHSSPAAMLDGIVRALSG